MNISILLLLLVSKLSSSFINISPFIATIIIGSYFINSKYHLLIMVWIAQFVSDISFGIHVSSIFVYLSYFCIVLILYLFEKNFKNVPFLSELFGKNVEESLLAADFKVKKNGNKTDFTFNPLSILTPGKSRNFFDIWE